MSGFLASLDEPIRLYDRRTDRRVQPVVVDADTGDPLDPRQLYPGPGPSFPADDATRQRRFADFYERRSDSVWPGAVPPRRGLPPWSDSSVGAAPVPGRSVRAAG